MNRYQKTIAIVAAADLLVMALFPPFLDNPMGWGVPRSFEGFRFLFLAPAASQIHGGLLTIEIAFVLANALAAWLALGGEDDAFVLPTARAVRGVALFGIVNAAVIALFPPFEPYSSAVQPFTGGFDDFYFAFGDKMHRSVCMPMLYLEAIVLASNLLAAWLMFGVARRR